MQTGITTVTQTGFNALSAAGAGTLVLVTPVRVLTQNNPTPVQARFGILTLNFAVPEPGTALLLGWGAVVLALAGRQRSRR